MTVDRQPVRGSTGAVYKQYLLWVLMVVFALNFMERMAFGLMMQDIKLDLALSDTQLGLLTGIATAFLYALMGIPIARWSDRGNRVAIICIMATLQCLAVVMLGLAGSFLQLLLIRVAASVGEAGCVPPAHSLIADSFSRAQRPRAVARYKLGAPLAYLIGFFAAGWLNELYGWRMTFVLLGLPGLALAALAWFTLREPRNQTIVTAADTMPSEPPPLHSAQPSFRTACLTLWTNRSFRHLLLAYSVWCFFSNGLLQWQPAFFIRSYGLGTGELGMWFAAIYGVGAGLGTYLGGDFAARHAAENESRQLRACALAFTCAPITFACAYLALNQYVAFGALAVTNFIIAMTLGPIFGSIQTLVQPHMRAMSIAIVLLFANLIGMGLGPLAVGSLSDALQPFLQQESLRYALVLMCPGFLWAAWHLWRASRTVAQDIAVVQAADDKGHTSVH